MDEMDLMKKLSDVPSPSPEAYDRARTALQAAMAEPADTVVRPKRWFSLPRAGIAAVGTAAVAVAAVMVTTGGGGGGTPANTPEAAPPAVVVDSPLVKLASELKAAPLTGDSSLIINTKIAPDKSRREYYTLYTDAGQVFRGDSPQTLAASVTKNQDDARPYEKNLLAAARLAATGDVEKAKAAMLTASGKNFLGIGLSPAEADKAWADARAEVAAQFREIGKEPPPAKPRPTGKELENLMDNHLWSSATQVLGIGASNPEVRAGVLKLFATMKEVSVAETEVGGQRALALTANAAILGGYGSEVLTVNADNGLPLSSEIIPNKESPNPSEHTKVDFRSSRVNLADVAAGRI